MMLLLVCMVDLDKTIGFVLRLCKLGKECMIGLFEICESAF